MLSPDGISRKRNTRSIMLAHRSRIWRNSGVSLERSAFLPYHLGLLYPPKVESGKMESPRLGLAYGSSCAIPTIKCARSPFSLSANLLRQSRTGARNQDVATSWVFFPNDVRRYGSRTSKHVRLSLGAEALMSNAMKQNWNCRFSIFLTNWASMFPWDAVSAHLGTSTPSRFIHFPVGVVIGGRGAVSPWWSQ